MGSLGRSLLVQMVLFAGASGCVGSAVGDVTGGLNEAGHDPVNVGKSRRADVKGMTLEDTCSALMKMHLSSRCEKSVVRCGAGSCWDSTDYDPPSFAETFPECERTYTIFDEDLSTQYLPEFVHVVEECANGYLQCEDYEELGCLEAGLAAIQGISEEAQLSEDHIPYYDNEPYRTCMTKVNACGGFVGYELETGHHACARVIALTPEYRERFDACQALGCDAFEDCARDVLNFLPTEYASELYDEEW
ncbi:MAG: hypothetical protein R3A78_03425 [Polyangiales bacterium]|nr:hypothetical protein [Myxococcales bacterium]